MKDEEIAEEYSQKICGYVRVELAQAFLAGLKAGRPQWHDLQKDKNDLPQETKRYLCQIICGVGSAITYECSDYDVKYNSWKDSYGDVIAWCEIPTFDKE